MSGVTAEILHVDLSTRTTRVEEITEPVLRRHLGDGGYEMAGWEGDTGQPTAARRVELEVDTSVFRMA